MSRAAYISRVAEMTRQEELRRVQQAPVSRTAPLEGEGGPHAPSAHGAGQKPPSPSPSGTSRSRIEFWTTAALKRRLQHKAIDEGRTVTEILIQLVTDYVEG